MSNNEKRSVVRGFESAIFDLIASRTTARQWGEWLRFPLNHAVAAGDVLLVIKLMRAGAKGSPVCAALKGGQVALARDLVKRGVSVTREDKKGDYPLNLAAANKDEETMSLLLQKGASPDTEGKEHRSLLYLAVANGRLATVNILLAAGANTSLRYFDDDNDDSESSEIDDEDRQRMMPWDDRDHGDDNSALDVAAINGHVGIVTALTRSGVDVNACDHNDSTALHKAARSTSNSAAGVIDVLVKAGGDVNALNQLGQLPLHYASKAGIVGAILALLKNGAGVEGKKYQRKSPLCLASLTGNLPAMKALLAAGAKVNAIERHSRSTALHDAVICRDHPDAPKQGGSFYSSLAARERWRKDTGNAVDLLLRWGADETAVNVEGETPLQVAARFFNGGGRVRDLLTQAPLDRNWRRRGWLLMYRGYPRRMVPIPSTREARSDGATCKRCRSRSVSTEAAGGAIFVRGGTRRGPGGRFVRGGAIGAVADGEGAMAADGGEGVIAPGGWNGVVTWVVGTELQGVFRNIVGYL